MDGMVIFTRSAVKMQNINYITGESWRYSPKTQIVAIDPDKKDSTVHILSEDFFSARNPQISYDGNFLLFTAQRKPSDPWQIWEMNLKNFKSRQVISSNENCIDPAYLPGARLVFSKLDLNDKLKGGYSLYTCQLDGSNIHRITFNPHSYFASSLLKDGRILTISRQVYPENGVQKLMVLRPDGTKCEIFYELTEGSTLLSQAIETANGKVIFIEKTKSLATGGSLVSIRYNRPLHSRDNLSSAIDGDFLAVSKQSSGKLLVSYRKSDADRFALYEFDPEKKILGNVIYKNSGYDILESVVAEQQEIPKKLPSEVDTGVKTGQLLCQDINVIKDQSQSRSIASQLSRIEVTGIDSILGVVQVEQDGSFYLKIIADKPFRIKTIDINGKLIQGPSDWIWLRPNERRGCIGCHEDHELAPQNIVPLAVKKWPVSLPIHVMKIVEKKVSSE